MALADRVDTHDEAHVARADPGLVGVQHHARVAQSGTFEGVFAREGRTEQQAAEWGELRAGVEAIRELVGMLQEGVRQGTMTPIEPGDHVLIASLHLVVRKGQQAMEHCRGS